MSRESRVIVILGQTATGKSELAVKIAKQFNGEIIAADSRQVYKGFDIGSGKVPRDKSTIYNLQTTNFFYKGIEHYLLDVANPKRVFTVSQYQKLAQKAIQRILAKRKTPIICGGTGLYIDAVIYNWQLPKIPPQPQLRKKLKKITTEELFKKLQKLDSRRAKNIDKNNRRRLIRALEIILTTGKPILAFQKTSPYDVLLIGIKKSPEELKRLIKKRLLKRLKQGMIEEVKNLRKKQKLSWQRLDDLGLEYRYVSRYLQGIISKEEMIEAIEKESWQYAKRQITWFKRDKNIHWITKTREAIELVGNFLANK